MSSIETSLCAAKTIRVKPVRFDVTDTGTVFAVQRLEVTTHDGNRFCLSVHLEEGCVRLQTGDVVVLPETLAMEQSQ